METLSVGIVGAGNIGSRHARFWSRVPGANIVAVADTHSGAAENLAGAYPGAMAYADADELVADPKVQVVHVCVPTHLHKEIAIASANAGKASPRPFLASPSARSSAGPTSSGAFVRAKTSAK